MLHLIKSRIFLGKISIPLKMIGLILLFSVLFNNLGVAQVEGEVTCNQNCGTNAKCYKGTTCNCAWTGRPTDICSCCA